MPLTKQDNPGRPSPQSSVTLRIRAVVELTVGTWCSNSTFEEIADQVKREGLAKFDRILEKELAKVVSEPKVIFIRTEEK